ncbi:MAG: preprotein translocase subunit SecY [Chloroflexi bacterium]|uniref:Protein translocase subunit SecY n=1 Tax=Candidatus Chlorohelix allophototropha TaxID=3003348 RepID=A0A8T7M2K3_9CHLR|nr:preprotein translocase subunit SecY [Chloroflexota bacterium]WJW65645.1 preprotein translocase subunit SecY [Chloroflexota bacterium L227-S17]
MLKAVIKAFGIPDLRRRIFFTLGILVIFRVIAHVPLPGISSEIKSRLTNLISGVDAPAGSSQGIGSVLGFLNIFSGGSLSNFSIVATGVYPYITATIIMQLLQPIIPALENLSKEGERGRAVINRWQHIITVPIAAVTAYGQIVLLKSQNVITGTDAQKLSLFGASSDFGLTVTVVISMTAGTMILVWMGELITEFGIGQGVSVLIFGGIVSNLPSTLVRTSQTGVAQNIISILIIVVVALLSIVGIVLVQEGQRKIPVKFPRQTQGNRVYGGQSTYIPLKVNSAGMIPLIFASSIIIFPTTVAGFFVRPNQPDDVISQAANWVVVNFGPSSILYQVVYFGMVVGFTYFYTLVLFNQQNITESLRDRGGFIPGYRPGKPTNDFLMKVLNRITLLGALFLGTIAVLPFLLGAIVQSQVNTFLSSTSLLIVVGVAVDTMKQLEAQLTMREYQGILR